MTNDMYVLGDTFALAKDIAILSHSVTPERDTPEALMGYADLHHIESKVWYFMTGERNEIYDLGRNYYFIEEDLEKDKNNPTDFIHTENIVLVDKHGHLAKMNL